jgi:hypothetical protein
MSTHKEGSSWPQRAQRDPQLVEDVDVALAEFNHYNGKRDLLAGMMGRYTQDDFDSPTGDVFRTEYETLAYKHSVALMAADLWVARYASLKGQA